VSSFGTLLTALQEFHAATQAAEPERAAVAAAGWETALADARAARDRITDGLQYGARWPSLGDGAAPEQSRS
jgi:hypothetical protein